MGQHEYGLKSLADEQLLSGLASIVHRRNQITAEFLAYLAELDERQLFLDLGFSSLFEYCVETLKLCESTAGRHIAAARMCRRYPEAFALVSSGALHASALSLLKKHLSPENAAELFELCTHRSARQVEVLLASRFPRADVRDLVRRLPMRAGGALDVERSAEQTWLAGNGTQAYAPDTAAADTGRIAAGSCPFVELTPIPVSLREAPVGLSPTAATSNEPPVELAKAPVELPSRDLVAARSMEASKSHRVEPLFAGRGPTEASKSRRVEPLSTDRYVVHFTADGEFCSLLERVRGLAGHRLPSGDLMTLLKRGLEAYERELEKVRFAVGGGAHRKRRVTPTSGALPAVNTEPDVPKPDVPGSDLPQSNPRPKSSPAPKRKRRLPAAVVRAVFLRDGKRCSYVSRDGRRCGARRCLELDHIDPRAVGGADTIDNLRLRCRAHNQRYARQYFGTSRVDAAVRNAQRRRAASRGCARA